MIGIYKIKNDRNGKVYIGSSNNITTRWQSHLSDLNKGCHDNWKLQADWNEYNITDFTFSVLEIVELKENLLDREQYYINLCLEHFDEWKLYNIQLDLFEAKEKFKQLHIEKLKVQGKYREPKPKKEKQTKAKSMKPKKTVTFKEIVKSNEQVKTILDNLYLQLTKDNRQVEFSLLLEYLIKHFEDNDIENPYANKVDFGSKLLHHLRKSLKVSVVNSDYYFEETIEKFNLKRTNQLVISKELRDTIYDFQAEIKQSKEKKIS